MIADRPARLRRGEGYREQVVAGAAVLRLPFANSIGTLGSKRRFLSSPLTARLRAAARMPN